MGDLALALVISGILLVYVSFLLYVRLGSLGIPRRRLRGLLVEFWIIYILVIGLFAIIRLWLGDVLPYGDIFRELDQRLRAFRALPVWQQATSIAMLIAAVGLIIHFLRSLRAAQAAARNASQPETEEHHD